MSLPSYNWHFTHRCPQHVQLLSITYTTFFPYNGAYSIPFDEKGNINTLQGGHEGDIEHVVLFVRKDDGSLFGAWFNAHRHRDGTYKPLSEIIRNEDGRVNDFIAINGHGHYYAPQTFPRIYFMASDRCAYGPAWMPDKVQLMPDIVDEELIEVRLVLYYRARHVNITQSLGMQWMLFNGTFGTAYQPYKHTSIKERKGKIARPSGCPEGAVHACWNTCIIITFSMQVSQAGAGLSCRCPSSRRPPSSGCSTSDVYSASFVGHRQIALE